MTAPRTLMGWGLLILPVLALSPLASASTYTFHTSGFAQTVDGDPLDVTTFFVLSDGRLQITVASMEAPNHETAAIYGVTPRRPASIRS